MKWSIGDRAGLAGSCRSSGLGLMDVSGLVSGGSSPEQSHRETGLGRVSGPELPLSSLLTQSVSPFAFSFSHSVSYTHTQPPIPSTHIYIFLVAGLAGRSGPHVCKSGKHTQDNYIINGRIMVNVPFPISAYSSEPMRAYKHATSTYISYWHYQEPCNIRGHQSRIQSL